VKGLQPQSRWIVARLKVSILFFGGGQQYTDTVILAAKPGSDLKPKYATFSKKSAALATAPANAANAEAGELEDPGIVVVSAFVSKSENMKSCPPPADETCTCTFSPLKLSFVADEHPTKFKNPSNFTKHLSYRRDSLILSFTGLLHY
jgi:hypothetical protein